MRRNNRLILTIMILVACSTICLGSDIEFKVRLLPEHSGAAVPVSVKLDVQVPDRGLYCLRDIKSGKSLPFQCDLSAQTIEFMVDVPKITKPVTRIFHLTPGAPVYGDSVSVRNTADKSLAVQEGDKLVLVYNYRSLLPQGVHENYRRSCYIHPVFGLQGELLTDDFPVDHYHHRGIAVMWSHVIVGGREYDLWGLKRHQAPVRQGPHDGGWPGILPAPSQRRLVYKRG